MNAPAPDPHPRLAGLRPEGLLDQVLPQEMGGQASAPEIPGVEILACLGRGGMGTVFRGRQTGLAREVAVKVVAPEHLHDPVLHERLEREARLMAGLRHPHLVAIHQFVPLPGGGAAIVMELLPGGTLRDRLREAPRGLPVETALGWAREIASALAAAHAAGVVHRDLKPENVLLDAAGAARVSDFGLARSLDEAELRLTRTGAAVGTADYMAPEQFAAAPPDARGDIYALGVVIYEMLTGQPPRGHFDPPHQARRVVPVGLSQAVMRALRPDPRQRFASMEEFLAALTPSAASRHLTRRAWTVIAGGSALGLLAALDWRRRTGARNDNPAPGVPPDRPVADWRDALSAVRLPEDVISGGWRREGYTLRSDAQVCVLALALEMPAAFTVEVDFVRLEGVHSVAVFFRTPGGVASVDLDGWGRHLAGVQSLDGEDLRAGGGFGLRLENGQPVSLRVAVRPDRVRVQVDGQLRLDQPIAGRRLAVVAPWAWDPGIRPAALAIGSYESPSRFTRVAWRPDEIDGG
jgi:tRNA A-37 threonylcarbamoyl transferase component Bud32